jgi:ATP-binding protein involved in chromosome partitioning
MSWLELPDGTRMDLFGSGGGAAVAAALTKTMGADVPLLGQIPVDPAIREGGDSGDPLVLVNPDSPAAVVLRQVAATLGGRARGLAGRSLTITPVRAGG